MSGARLDRHPAVCYKDPMPLVIPRARRKRFCLAALVATALAVVLACSSDPDGPVGSESDLLGSKPGDVFQDTIAVYADTVLPYYTLISSGPLQIGQTSTHTYAMIINISFSGAALDAGRVVESASLRLVASDITGTVPARFYRLRDAYANGDSVPSLDTLAVIPDPESGSVERLLQTFPPNYPLPPALVQGWVRGDTTRTAIAILYTDTSDRTATFNSAESASDRPYLQVNYADGFQRTFKASADAIFVRPRASTGNLIVSDGFVHRVWFRARLDELAEQSAVHTARVRLHLVPGSVVGTNTFVEVYIPESSDPNSSGFTTGQRVTNAGILDGDEVVEFPLTNSIFLTLQGTLPDNGFAIRMQSENTEVRQVEFYGTSAPDTLRPRVFITSSTPADFEP